MPIVFVSSDFVVKQLHRACVCLFLLPIFSSITANELPTPPPADTVIAASNASEDVDLSPDEEPLSGSGDESNSAPETEAQSEIDENDLLDEDSASCESDTPVLERIDRVRRSTHARLCNTVKWIDGLFGDDHEFNDKDFTAMVSVGFRQDEFDGFDPRLRVRIKSQLPNVSSRFNAFVGRVDGDSYISNTEVRGNQVNDIGLRSNDEQEDEWLIGLGYRRAKEDRGGFDMSVGAKLNSGLSPYAQVAYRRNFMNGENHHWRTRQTVFWKKTEKFGFSSRLNYNYYIDDNDIFEWTTDVKYTEELEQWEWITSTSIHHSFTSKRGLSSRIYARGEENIEVGVPEFGVTFTYITPVLREWFIMEAGVDFRWEREFERQQNYQSATRFAIQFEMLLGDYYRRYRTAN